MIARILAIAVLLWAFGFVYFATVLPQPLIGGVTDAVVVPTGSGGRIDRGLEVLDEGLAARMFVSGVDPDVTRSEFAAQFKVGRRRMRCCVMLGADAADTRGNGRETAQWVAKEKVKTLRLVTSDWHMRRASFELSQEMPANITILEDAVPARPSFRLLFLEYNKLLASAASRLIGE
jgi:uncharacterized SAM-binding protein YcdF (DUF218 family)